MGMTASIGIGDQSSLDGAKDYILQMCAKFNLHSAPCQTELSRYHSLPAERELLVLLLEEFSCYVMCKYCYCRRRTSNMIILRWSLTHSFRNASLSVFQLNGCWVIAIDASFRDIFVATAPPCVYMIRLQDFSLAWISMFYIHQQTLSLKVKQNLIVLVQCSVLSCH